MAAELESAAVSFSPEERESFFDSSARHQRAAARVARVADACALALAFVVAVLMSPLLYAVLGLLLDAVNLLLPTPDLIGSLGNAAVAVTDDFGQRTRKNARHAGGWRIRQLDRAPVRGAKPPDRRAQHPGGVERTHVALA